MLPFSMNLPATKGWGAPPEWGGAWTGAARKCNANARQRNMLETAAPRPHFFHMVALLKGTLARIVTRQPPSPRGTMSHRVSTLHGGPEQTDRPSRVGLELAPQAPWAGVAAKYSRSRSCGWPCTPMLSVECSVIKHEANHAHLKWSAYGMSLITWLVSSTKCRPENACGTDRRAPVLG